MIKPTHYNGSFVFHFIDYLELSFALGNVVKYCARAGKKPEASFEEDLQKALTYLKLEMDSINNDGYLKGVKKSLSLYHTLRTPELDNLFTQLKGVDMVGIIPYFEVFLASKPSSMDMFPNMVYLNLLESLSEVIQIKLLTVKNKD